MKKATFLILFFSLLLIRPSNDTLAESFSFSDMTISLEEVFVNGERQIKVVKGGMNPFINTVGISGYDLSYEGVTLYEQYVVVYGYSSDTISHRNYSGFYIVLDEYGDVVKDDIIDRGDMETVREAYLIDDILILELIQSTDHGYGAIILSHQFYVFDKTLTLQETYEIEEPLKRMVIEQDRLLGRYQGSMEYDFGILSDGTLMWKDDDIGVIDDNIYYGEVCLSSINSFVLDEETYIQGTCIDTIGYHYLSHQNQSFTFTIEPTIQGVEDGMIYYEPIQIDVNRGYITLNGDGYINQQEISEVGRYTLSIEGSNNYRKDIHFEIGAIVQGITNNTVYDELVTITFTGQGYLNNQYVTSPYTVEHPGDYIFKIKGDQGYVENYYFEIEEKNDKVDVIDFIQKIDVFVLGSILVFGLFIVKKKR